jgi:hypothetical protein
MVHGATELEHNRAEHSRLLGQTISRDDDATVQIIRNVANEQSVFMKMAVF